MGMGTLTRTQPLPGNDEHDPTSPRPAAKQTAAAARSLHKFPEPSPQTPARDPPTSPTTPPPRTHTCKLVNAHARMQTHGQEQHAAKATCLRLRHTHRSHTRCCAAAITSHTNTNTHTHNSAHQVSAEAAALTIHTHTHTPLLPMKHPEAHPPTTRDCRAPHALP